MTDVYVYESLKEFKKRVTEKKKNQLKEKEQQSKEMKLKEHMLLTDKLKKIDVVLKLLCKQFDDFNKPNMSHSEKEELMQIIQDQKKLKNRMEIILAKIHHDSSDVSNKDKDNYYPN